MRQLVDKGFGEEAVLRVIHAAPRAERHVGRAREITHVQIGDAIRNVRGLGRFMLVHEMVLPGNGRAGRVECSLETTQHSRSIAILADVFLATPDELHGMTGMLSESCSLNRIVGLRSSTESATEILIVNRHLLGRQIEGRSDRGLESEWCLRSRPDLTSTVFDSGQGIQRLHTGMREIGNPVLGFHHPRRSRERRVYITANPVFVPIATVDVAPELFEDLSPDRSRGHVRRRR